MLTIQNNNKPALNSAYKENRPDKILKTKLTEIVRLILKFNQSHNDLSMFKL